MCDESNGVKFSQKFVHLVYSLRNLKLNKKNVHTKIYKYNVKLIKKGLEDSFRLKHVIQTFI